MGSKLSRISPEPLERQAQEQNALPFEWRHLSDPLPEEIKSLFGTQYLTEAALQTYFLEKSDIETQYDSLAMRCLFIAYTKDLSKLTIANKPYGVNSQAIDLLTALLTGVILDEPDLNDSSIYIYLDLGIDFYTSRVRGRFDRRAKYLLAQWQKKEYVKENINANFIHLYDLFARPSSSEENCYRYNGLSDSDFIKYLALLPPEKIGEAMDFYTKSGLLTLASVLGGHETGYHFPPILALCMCGYSTHISKWFFGSYEEDLKTQVRQFFRYILNPDSEEQPEAQPMVLSASWTENDESIQNKKFYNNFKLAILPRLELLNRIWSFYLLNEERHENHEDRVKDVMAKLMRYYRNSFDIDKCEFYIKMVLKGVAGISNIKEISENWVNDFMSYDKRLKRSLGPILYEALKMAMLYPLVFFSWSGIVQKINPDLTYLPLGFDPNGKYFDELSLCYVVYAPPAIILSVLKSIVFRYNELPRLHREPFMSFTSRGNYMLYRLIHDILGLITLILNPLISTFILSDTQNWHKAVMTGLLIGGLGIPPCMITLSIYDLYFPDPNRIIFRNQLNTQPLLPVAVRHVVASNGDDANNEGGALLSQESLEPESAHRPSPEVLINRVRSASICFGSRYLGKCFQPSSAQSPFFNLIPFIHSGAHSASP